MKILLTGSAGFIGFHLAIALLEKGYEVVGVDNINDYYDQGLKYSRLKESGIDCDLLEWNKELQSNKYAGYQFVKLNLEDKGEMLAIFRRHGFDIVINLAAQAGVRYSIINPDAYIQSNIVGFTNILEACRNFNIKHFIYASSSSVYGLNEQIPFSTTQAVNHPVSLYAATKKSNELMAHAYSYLYKIPTTGLRFFTVYGPLSRPDMACFLFTDAIVKNRPIQVFNNGDMARDFTYVDDVVNGIVNIINKPTVPNKQWSGKNPDAASSSAPYKIYNLGNNEPVNLMSFIHELESQLGKKAIIELKGMQAGDVPATWADIEDSFDSFGYVPQTSIESGLQKFVAWYKEYYNVETSETVTG